MSSKSCFEGVGCESYVGFVTIGGRNFCFIDDIACGAFSWQGQSSFFWQLQVLLLFLSGLVNLLLCPFFYLSHAVHAAVTQLDGVFVTDFVQLMIWGEVSLY